MQLHAFLTSAVDGSEWPASLPGRLTPGERSSGTRYIEGWVGSRVGFDAVDKRKILPLPGFEPRPSSLSLYRLLSVPEQQ
jgi:hypothetical protein